MRPWGTGGSRDSRRVLRLRLALAALADPLGLAALGVPGDQANLSDSKGNENLVGMASRSPSCVDQVCIVPLDGSTQAVITPLGAGMLPRVSIANTTTIANAESNTKTF